jgi:hypothetical protein
MIASVTPQAKGTAKELTMAALLADNLIDLC